MKTRFITSMVLACAAFIGVSCEREEPTKEPEPVIPTSITIDECEELAAEGGVVSLAYSIVSPVEGAQVAFGESSAEWLHDFAADSTAISFTFDANPALPGSEPREASFVVTYADLDPVTVQVRQASAEPQFEVTFSNVTTTSADVTCTPKDLEATYLMQKVNASALENVGGSPEAWLNNYLNGTGKWYATLYTGVYPEEGKTNSYSCYEPAYILVVGATRDDNYVYTYTTPIHLYEIPLLPKPVLTIDNLENNVTYEAGSLALTYTVEHPIEGVEVSVSKTPEWVSVELDDKNIYITYEENAYASARAAKITFSYSGADETRTVVINQEANPTAEIYSFELSVVESHYDHVIVNITPSNENVKYALKGISKSEFEGYSYGGSDLTLQEKDLASSYYKPTFLTGSQENYRLEVGATSSSLEWYIYVYAVSDDETTAISDVKKVLVTINFDKPALEFETSPVEVPAEGGKCKVKYVLTNPVEGGVVKFNGSQSNYYGVLVDNSWTINNETCEIEFEVNPYDETQYSHYAYLYIAYYASAESTKTIVTASVKVNQAAPAN